MAYASPVFQFLKSLQDRMKEQQAVLQEALRLQNQTINDFSQTVEGFVNPTCYEDDMLVITKLHQALANIGPTRDALEAARDHIATCLERSYLTSPVPEPVAAPVATTDKRPRVVNFDVTEVENAVLEILADGRQYRKSALMREIDATGVLYSKAGLERILHTHPSIEITGDRDQTRYQLKEIAVGA